MKKQASLVQIKKRKITARQYSQVDEGKVFWTTPDGRKRAGDGDWLLELKPNCFAFISKHAMEYLTTKDDDETKGA